MEEANADEVRATEDEVAYFQKNLDRIQSDIDYYEMAMQETDVVDEAEMEMMDKKLNRLYEKFDMEQASFDELDGALSDLKFEQFNRKLQQQDQDILDAEFEEKRNEELKARYQADLTAF